MFIAGAGSRLLPASIPFRYFGAAAVAHPLAWLALFAGAEAATVFVGGLGPALAALHLVTLGVLATTAIGASLQLLPVATRQPIVSVRLAAFVWWLLVPGIALLAWGMANVSPRWIGIGAAAINVALLAYGWLLLRNLQRAKGMPEVVLHGWVALASLAATIATSVAMAAVLVHGIPLDYRALAATHLIVASFGFMGMLCMGISYLLVPMFALTALPQGRAVRAPLALATAAIALAAAAPWTGWHPFPTLAAAVCGTAAVLLHLRVMTRALRQRARPTLDRSFVLVRFAWAMWVAAIAVGAAIALLPSPPMRLYPLFGVLLAAGWLLGFALAILQRIAPFLATMHAGKHVRPVPSVASLTPIAPLRIHLGCHVVAVLLLAVAVLAVEPALTRAAAAIGLAGAIAWLAFLIGIRQRLIARRAASIVTESST